jgi:hypothetical protein
LWAHLAACCRQLDADPAPLEQFLAGVSGLGRVQNYHGALVQFWLQHLPATDHAGRPKRAGAATVRRVVWGLQVGGRRLTSDLKILAAMHASDSRPTNPAAPAPAVASEAPAAEPEAEDCAEAAGDGLVLHVEPNIAFAIDASALLPAAQEEQQEVEEEEEEQELALGSLVSFDLDSNLQYRLRATRVLSRLSWLSWLRATGSRRVIRSRWVSEALALAGEAHPRRLNNQLC